MMLRLHFTLIAFLFATLLFGCDGCEVSRSGDGGENLSVESGTGSPDSTSPVEPANKDGWLVSTNSDGLELKVRCEELEGKAFRIHYILKNTGTEPVYRIVSRKSPYFILIRPLDVAHGEERDGVPVVYKTPRPADMKAEELMILFGVDKPPWNVLLYAMSVPQFVLLDEKQSISSSVDIKFPVKRTSDFGVREPGRGEDEIDEMAKSKSGLPCVIAFNYVTKNDYDALVQRKPKENEAYGDRYRLIESKRLMLKID